MKKKRMKRRIFLFAEEMDERAFLRERNGNCVNECVKNLFQWNNNERDCRRINNSVRAVSAVQSNALYFPRQVKWKRKVYEEVNGVAWKVPSDSGFAKWSVLQAPLGRHAGIISTAIIRRITPDGSFKTLRAVAGIAERTSISSAADLVHFRRMDEAGFRKRQVWEEHRDRQVRNWRSIVSQTCARVLCSVSRYQSIRISIREENPWNVSDKSDIECLRRKEKEREGWIR